MLDFQPIRRLDLSDRSWSGLGGGRRKNGHRVPGLVCSVDGEVVYSLTRKDLIGVDSLLWGYCMQRGSRQAVAPFSLPR